MPRPLNSKNKPKFVYVSIKHLCERLKDDAMVPVDKDYIHALMPDLSLSQDIGVTKNNDEDRNELEFSITKPM